MWSIKWEGTHCNKGEGFVIPGVTIAHSFLFKQQYSLTFYIKDNKENLKENDRFTTNSQDYILYPTESPLRISSSETLPISSRIKVGPAGSKASSDNVVRTAMHLQIIRLKACIFFYFYSQ